MTKVNLSRKPYLKQIFYIGTYTWENQEYNFSLTEQWSEDSPKPTLIVEFADNIEEIPFNVDMACTQITYLHIPEQNENTN